MELSSQLKIPFQVFIIRKLLEFEVNILLEITLLESSNKFDQFIEFSPKTFCTLFGFDSFFRHKNHNPHLENV